MLRRRLYPSYELEREYAAPMEYWIAIGLKGNGSYGENEDFAVECLNTSDADKRTSLARNLIKENLYELWNLNHLTSKTRYNFASGNMGLSDYNRYEVSPAYMCRFFNAKLASEWNNPTSDCFLIQNYRLTSLELKSIIKSTINDGGKLNIIFTFLFDIQQAVFMFGILIYFINYKNADLKQLLAGMLFIGAFIFWLFGKQSLDM